MSTSGWIGVDLDGTLAHYEGWDGGKIGAPIPLMVDRVKRWRSELIEVRIFTARVYDHLGDPELLKPIIEQIESWSLEHIGEVLPITCVKDFHMIELWDDRAVSVKQNTGVVLGGTGRFPGRKAAEDDEGELRVMVSTQNGILRIDFGKEVGWVGLDRQSALGFAALVHKRALEMPE